MNITFRAYKKEKIRFLKDIWKDILADGVAFPGETLYEEEEFEKMLAEQSAVTCISADNKLAGYYILHPNNIGRCSHVEIIGTNPKGFRLKDGVYSDMHIMLLPFDYL